MLPHVSGVWCCRAYIGTGAFFSISDSTVENWLPGFAAMEFAGGRVGVRGSTFGVELANKGEGSVGLRMGSRVERAVVVGNDMLGSTIVSNVPTGSAVVSDNLL